MPIKCINGSGIPWIMVFTLWLCLFIAIAMLQPEKNYEIFCRSAIVALLFKWIIIGKSQTSFRSQRKQKRNQMKYFNRFCLYESIDLQNHSRYSPKSQIHDWYQLCGCFDSSSHSSLLSPIFILKIVNIILWLHSKFSASTKTNNFLFCCGFQMLYIIAHIF